MRDVSAFFERSYLVRNSTVGAVARLQGASFSIFAATVDALRIPRLVDWVARRPGSARQR